MKIIEVGKLFFLKTSAIILVQAIVTKLVDGAPFQQSKLPQTNPRAIFHPNTAAGKLKAVIIPTSPKGFHYSIMK